MDTGSSFSPYGHDLRMLTFAPPATWEPAILDGPAPGAGRSDEVSSDRASAVGTSSVLSTLAQPRGSSLSQGFASGLTPPPRMLLSPLNLPTSHPPPTSTTCHLVNLPPELLDQIFSYVLPYTTQTQKGIAWVRRSTALLATCRPLHNAGARHLYGTNTFVLRTSFTGTQWHLSWIRQRTIYMRSTSRTVTSGATTNVATAGPPQASPGVTRYHDPGDSPFLGPAVPGETFLSAHSAATSVADDTYSFRGSSRLGVAFSVSAPESDVPLVPSRLKPFPASIAERYLRLLRFVAIEVRVEDAYTGAIKYGYGGPGLADGVRWQVQRLVDVLSLAEELRSVVIRLSGLGTGRSEEERKILEPVAGLRNVGTLEIESGWPC